MASLFVDFDYVSVVLHQFGAKKARFERYEDTKSLYIYKFLVNYIYIYAFVTLLRSGIVWPAKKALPGARTTFKKPFF